MTTFYCFLLRFLQAALAASPYILAGLLIAGFLRLFVGQNSLQRWFTGDQLSGPLKAFGLGLLVPVCAFGVLPISRELLRAGIPRRSVFTFTLGAPLFHPLTIAYGLSVMDVSLLITLLGGAVAVLLIASRWLSDAENEPLAPSIVDELDTGYGIRRVAAMGIVAMEHLRPRYLVEILLGLTGAGLVGAWLQPDALGGLLAADNMWAAPLSAGLSLFLSIIPEQAIAIFDQMFGHGNSLAAVFALLIFGVGMNLGTIAGLRHLFGIRAVLPALTILLVGVILFGSLANSTIYTPQLVAGDDHAGHEGEGHTHAFDFFAQPAAILDAPSAVSAFWLLLMKTSDSAHWSLLALLIVLMGGSCVLQHSRVRSQLRHFLHKESNSPQAKSWDHHLSHSWIKGISAILGLAAVYTTSMIYFPAPSEIFEDMSMVRADAVLALNSGNQEDAIFHFQKWENLTHKLSIGGLLRGSGTGDQRISSQKLRQSLERLLVGISTKDDPERLKMLLSLSEAAYQQCRDTFDGKPLPVHSTSEPGMPEKVSSDEEQALYLTPGGLYTQEDIVANGSQTVSQRYAGFRSSHDMNPGLGADLCPITLTKANAECTWIINGKKYMFCCPPCIDEFVKWAKESPEKIKDPSDYIKR